jgi:lysophospholipase L1-like esterase
MPAPPPTDTGPLAQPVPPGWPGDDPTVPDELGLLGGRPRRPPSFDDLGSEPVRRGRPLPADDDRPRPRRRAGDMHGGGPGPTATGRARVGATDGGHDERLEFEAPGDGPHDDVDVVEGDDLVAGVQPAGRALVVMVVALVLAMLVNADALVERAERRPTGPQRDRALAVWHPVQDVSHALQLHRIRELADWAAGDDGSEAAAPAPGRGSGDRGTGDPGGGADDAAAGTADTPARDGEVRTPTEDEPLRLWVGGDFMAQVFGESLLAKAEPTGLIDPELHYESASGLTRSDYYDWPEALGRDLDDHDAEVVVVMLGVNDGQGIMLADGTPVPAVDDPRWATEYRRRVGALMDQLRAPGRLVVWVGQPPMRNPDFAAAMAVVNQAYVDEAAGRPWVTYVDAAALLGGPGGTYAENLPAGPGGAGTPVEVRQPDGIHLAPAGGERLAAEVMAVIDAAVDLPG